MDDLSQLHDLDQFDIYSIKEHIVWPPFVRSFR